MTNLEVSDTSFPGSPVTGQDFFRADLGFWCYWDGTRWVTTQVYERNIEEAVYSANTSSADQWIGDVYAVKFERFEIRTYVDTTNSGVSYWDCSVRSIALDDSVTVVSTVSTSADSPDVFVDHGEAADTAVPANYGGIFFRAQKGGGTGTPGDLTFSATVKYRLIIT